MEQTKSPGHALGMYILFALNDSSLFKFKRAVKTLVWSCDFTWARRGLPLTLTFQVLYLMPRLSDCNNFN